MIGLGPLSVVFDILIKLHVTHGRRQRGGGTGKGMRLSELITEI